MENSDTRIRKICPDCNSRFVYKRRGAGDWICQSCGWTGKAPEQIVTKCYKSRDSRIDKLIRGTSTS